MERGLFGGGSIKYSRLRILDILGWAIIIAIFLSFWQILSFLYEILIPSPIETLKYILGIDRKILIISIFRTLYNSVLGFSTALLLAIVVGGIAYLNDVARKSVEVLNKVIQSVSVLVWTLITIMIFGVTSGVPPILVTMAASFPILLSAVVSGISDVEKKYYELKSIIGANRLQEFQHIILPGTIPYLLSASRAAMGVALRISVVAEAFGAAGGIGYMLIYNYDLGDKTGVFAWALLLVFLMIIIDYFILAPLEKWGKRWM